MANRTIRTPIKKEKFLKALREQGNITRACRVARIGRTAAYEWREEEPDFRAEWEEAEREGLERFGDELEEEARRRAIIGTQKPVFQQGKLVGKVREFSDSLLIFLLKHNKPHKYGERFEREANADPNKPLRIEVEYVNPEDNVIDATEDPPS